MTAGNTSTPRLLAAAKEFNIGKEQLIDFLKEKGFDVSDKPTSKLSEGMYLALKEEFDINYKKNNEINDSTGIEDSLELTITTFPFLAIEEEYKILKENNNKNETEFKRYQLLSKLIEPNLDVLELDLSNLELKSIPIEISRFKKLEKINLSHNEISYLKNIDLIANLKDVNLSNNQINETNFLKKLKHIEKLKLSNNQIKLVDELPDSLKELDISNNQIRGYINPNNLKSLDLSSNKDGLSIVIFGATNFRKSPLERLNISNNSLSNIENFLEFQNLNQLIANGNYIKNVDLSQLNTKELEKLDLSNNILENITLTKEVSINLLYLENNKIENLSFLENLHINQQLSLSNNKISNIEPFENFLKKNESINIYLQENPIENIKIDQDYNASSTQLLIEYFERKKSLVTTKQKNFLQLLVLGNGEAGKTSFIRSLIETYQRNGFKTINPPILPKESTHGNIHYYWDIKLGDKEYTILIKDFGGQEYYHHFHPMFYNQDAMYFIVESLNKDDDTLSEFNGIHTPTYWFKSIEHFLQILHNNQLTKEELINNTWLIGTKIDKSDNDLPKLCKKQFKVCCNIDTSQIDEYCIKKFEAYQDIVFYEFINSLEKTNATSYLGISLKIYEILIKQSNDIDNKDFHFVRDISSLKDLIPPNDKSIDLEELRINWASILMDLKSLGIILYFPGVYNISDKFILYPQKFSEYIFDTILNKDKIGNGKTELNDPFIESFLEHFEIVFKDGESGQYIIPEYLPYKNEAQDLIDIATEGLKFKLTVKFDEFIPQGILSKIICFFGTNPHKKWYWKNGIFFTHEYRNTKFQALITKDDYIINISTNEKIALEYLFDVLMMSYYNYEFNIYDNKDNIESNEYRRYKDFVSKLKQETLQISLRLNEDNDFYSLEYFKLRIEDIEHDNYEISNQKIYQRIKDYNPLLQKLFNMKTFNEKYNPKKIFISYSKQDLTYVNKFLQHLTALQRDGKVSHWYCTELIAGTEWDEQIQKNFEDSDIICFMVSPNFMNTQYIYEHEIKKAIDRKENDPKFQIVPIILDYCKWTTKDYNLGKYTALPFTAHPITDFDNQNMAWYVIESALNRLIETDMMDLKDDYYTSQELPSDILKIYERITGDKINKNS